MKVETEEKIAIMNETGNDYKMRGNIISVRLPRLELKKFDGSILKWQEFWGTFESTIHKNNDLQNLDKFNYLRSQLRGQASEMLMGIELTNDNYNTAIALLKESYGKKQVMTDLHYVQINNFPMASYKTASLREFYDCTEKHLRVLQLLGESNNQNNVLTMMKPKLPRSVLLRLEEQREENEEWTVESFRKRLLRYINIQEHQHTDYQVWLLQRPKDFKRHPLKEQGQGYITSTTEALLADEYTAKVNIGVMNVYAVQTSK